MATAPSTATHTTATHTTCAFQALPPELIDHILTHLSPYELAAVSVSCQLLRKHANSDVHWRRCVQQNVPCQTLDKPGPCGSFRELYACHDPVWFLPRNKLWFCDNDLAGSLVVARYDGRRGCIEGYQLLAVRTQATMQQWAADQQVVIHSFEPRVALHLDKPVVHFALRRTSTGVSRLRRGSFADEMPLALADRTGALFCNFLLTRRLDDGLVARCEAAAFPYGEVWPPPPVPARHRVMGAQSGGTVVDLRAQDRPVTRGQICDSAFRIRKWMQMAGSPPVVMASAGPRGGFGGSSSSNSSFSSNSLGSSFGSSSSSSFTVLGGLGSMTHHPGPDGIHIGEQLVTYATLDAALYTPTPTRPWRGIWVGDYSGHGCEFLLLHQPDEAPVSDEQLGLVRGATEPVEAWRRRRRDARIFRGRLEAIKLTGDPNVPRGEASFVAPDLGRDGQLGVATDPPFTGAVIVQSRGHVAGTGFVADKYIESQLFLISPSRIAQYWVGFGHISYFHRIDIDDYVVP